MKTRGKFPPARISIPWSWHVELYISYSSSVTLSVICPYFSLKNSAVSFVLVICHCASMIVSCIISYLACFRMMRGKIYIGGLVKSIRKPDVEKAFGRFGKLKEVWLAHNPPGFAFVHYVFPEDAEDAIRAMDGKRLSGAKIRVESAKSLGRKAPSSAPARRPLPPPLPPAPTRQRERARAPLPVSRRPYTPPPRSLSPPSPRRRLPPMPRGRSPLPPPPALPPLRRRSPLPLSRGRSPPSPLPLRRKGRPPSPPRSWSPPPPPRDSYSRSDPSRYRDERSSQYTSDRVPYISFDRRRMNRSPLPPPLPPPPPVRYRSRSPLPRRRYKWGWYRYCLFRSSLLWSACFTPSWAPAEHQELLAVLEKK